MNLPQELLDEIFSHIPPHDMESLKSCSLVSKSWAEPNRRVLFANIRIPLHAYRSWKDTISPSNTLLRHARSLEYFHILAEYTPYPRRPFYTLRDYLPSFSKLRTLNLCRITIEPTISDNLELLSAFQHTLVSLTLSSVLAAWSSFVVFVGHFPHLRNLEIIGTSLREDDLPIPKTVHAGRGSLSVDVYSAGVLCDRFAGLKPEYDELRLIGGYDHRLVVAVERSLQSLVLAPCDSEYIPDLSCCANLRQLSCATMEPEEEERMLVSSITSTNFQKLIFKTQFITVSHLNDSCWMRFEEALCGLFDRLRKLGYKHTLDVELQANIVRLHKDACLEHAEFLSEFREKGRVSILEVETGERWEWSRA